MDDLAQYSPRRRPRRFDESAPFRFQTPLVFTIAPPAELTSEQRQARPHDWRRPLAGRGV